MSNPNTNCLEGMACPKCESYGPFHIDITTTVLHDDDGVIDDSNDKHWGSDSWCMCNDCRYTATIKEFESE